MTFDHIEMASKLCCLKIISSRSAVKTWIELIVTSLDLNLPWSLLLTSVCLERFLILLFIDLRWLVWFVIVFLNKFFLFIVSWRWSVAHISIRKRDVWDCSSLFLRSHNEFSSQLDRRNFIEINRVFIHCIGTLAWKNVAG